LFYELRSEIIKKLEEKITGNQQQDKPSDTANSIKHLKQSIEKIKEDLKKLTGGILFSGFLTSAHRHIKTIPISLNWEILS
jgi:cob(I)alamin adenosyltransferase